MLIPWNNRKTLNTYAQTEHYQSMRTSFIKQSRELETVRNTAVSGVVLSGAGQQSVAPPFLQTYSVTM